LLSIYGDYLLMSGKPAEAEQRFREAIGFSNEFQVYNLVTVARSLLWQRDLEGARAFVSKLESDPFGGPWASALRTAFRAGVGALQGRTVEAIGGYRNAIERLLELGWVVEGARVMIDAAYLLGPRSELESQLHRTRAVIAELRLEPFRQRLDEALAEHEPAAASRSAIAERATTPA
jgi:hypothetical protein